MAEPVSSQNSILSGTLTRSKKRNTALDLVSDALSRRTRFPDIAVQQTQYIPFSIVAMLHSIKTII